MSTRDGALALLLEKLTALEYDFGDVAKYQQAAADDALRIALSYPHAYFDCAAEHRQAASWLEAIREEITACGLLDRLDAEQTQLCTDADTEIVAYYVTPAGAHVRVERNDSGDKVVFTATCGACGTIRPFRRATQALYTARSNWLGDIEEALDSACQAANTHAVDCRRIPQNQWPTGGAR